MKKELNIILELVECLDQLRCGPDILVGSAIHKEATNRSKSKDDTPVVYGYTFHLVENIDPFEVVLIQNMFPNVIIRYSDIPELISKYNSLTFGLKVVTRFPEGYCYLQDKGKVEILKVRQHDNHSK